MMLPAFVLLAAAQAVPTAEAPLENEIVVMAERLRRIRISPGVTIRKGTVAQTSACKVKRSSGDAALDALACDAVTLCASRPAPSRKIFNTCVEDEAIASIRRLLAERRAQAAPAGTM